MSDQNKIGGADHLVQKWGRALDGIKSEYMARVTAQLLENQAKAILSDSKLNEDISTATTKVGHLGTFQKFAFPLVRRVFPELIFNKIGATQPMDGPVSQIFYLGHSRAYGNISQEFYGKYTLTPIGQTTNPIGTFAAGSNTLNLTGGATAGLAGSAAANFSLSSVLRAETGSPSTTYGGKLASWPLSTTILGWNVSAGERLTGTGIPEITFHIQQQPVVARTRKMRALWTIEASQDLKSYHNLDLERELTELLSKEIALEIDRELIEDVRMLAYGFTSTGTLGGWDAKTLDNANPNNFGQIGGQGAQTDIGSNMIPGSWTYEQTGLRSTMDSQSNVFVIDFAQDAAQFAPQHLGHRYANLLAMINFASQDIYKTTLRGPGTVLVTSPLMAAILESSAKLEGGIAREDAPSNMDGKAIRYVGKFAGRYDLIVDPLYPEDEIMIAYNGSNPMDAGYVYCPYIPLMPLDTVTDPDSFQPRKGILTRYGKAAVQPVNRFYRILRVIGLGPNYMLQNITRNAATGGGLN